MNRCNTPKLPIPGPQPVSRRLLSQRHPFLYRASVAFHRLRRRLRARFDGRTYCTVASVGAEPLPYRIKKHQSLLMRKLGSTDLRLQHNKVDNLRLVVANLDGVLLRPGETFSFCQLVGKPSRRRGFKEGVELSFGVARPGIGGGICQSTNLLYWLALHAELTISERHHHTCDPFPDEGRVLPWSSGAAVFYNYLDFQLTNPTPSTFQIRLWLTDTHLVGSCAAIGNLPSSSTSTRRTIAFSRARTPTSAATRSGAAP